MRIKWLKSVKIIIVMMVVALVVSVPAYASSSLPTQSVNSEAVVQLPPVIPDNGNVIDPLTGKEAIVIVQPSLLLNGVTLTADVNNNYTVSGGTLTQVAGTNTNVINGSITVNGTTSQGTALNITGQITDLSNYDTRSYQIDCGSFYVGTYGTSTPITVTLGGSTVNCFAWAIRGDAVTVNAGTSTINTTLMFDNAAKSGHVYNVVNVVEKINVQDTTTYVPRIVLGVDKDNKPTTQTVYDPVVTETISSVYPFVEGASTFNNITFSASDQSYVTHNITAAASTTKSGVVSVVPTGKNPSNTATIKIAGKTTSVTPVTIAPTKITKVSTGK